MKAKIGRLLCRLGDRLLGVGDRLLQREAKPPHPETATTVTTERPLVNFDHDSLSAAFAILAAVERQDVPPYHVIAKHSDPTGLTLSLIFAVGDALAEPSSTDLAAYADDLFDRLARRRQ
jgi:hypothetical protein